MDPATPPIATTEAAPAPEAAAKEEPKPAPTPAKPEKKSATPPKQAETSSEPPSKKAKTEESDGTKPPALPPVNPSLTTVSLQIQNPELTLASQLEFETIFANLKLDSINVTNDYLKFTDLTSRNQCDPGARFTVDVQSDTRNFFAIASRFVTTHYDNKTAATSPMVTHITMVAHLLMCFYCYILSCDIHHRQVISYHATFWRNDEKRKHLYNALMRCRFPSKLAFILEALAPLNDALRKDLEYTPSYAGFHFPIDFGKFFPIQALLHGHNLMIETRANSPINEFKRKLANSIVFTVNNVQYNVSKVLGYLFLHENRCTLHPNFINQHFETLVQPATQRTYTVGRTAFAPIKFTPLTCPEDVNPYDLLLNFSDGNFHNMLSLVKAFDNFYSQLDSAAPPLAAIFEKAHGVSILSHFIMTPQLPTHHYLPPSEAADEQDITYMDDAAFARVIHYMETPALPQHTHIYPGESAYVEPEFYDMERHAGSIATLPYTFKAFTPDRDVDNKVLLAQPYQTSVATGTLSLAHGLYIEANSITAITIPTPNPFQDMYENNSHYVQGTIPVTKLRMPPAFNQPNHIYPLIERVPQPLMSSHLGIAIRDMSKAIIPVFDARHVEANIVQPIPGIDNTHHHIFKAYGHTVAAWRDTANVPLPDASVHLWSSYRYVKEAANAARNVSLYSTMNGFYGISMPVHKIDNPGVLLYGP
jgi:hypothetical protein